MIERRGANQEDAYPVFFRKSDKFDSKLTIEVKIDLARHRLLAWKSGDNPRLNLRTCIFLACLFGPEWQFKFAVDFGEFKRQLTQ